MADDRVAGDRKILVVDDEDAIRHSLATFLRESGWPRIVEARNGVEAIEKLSQERFSLVITDISMPELSGLDVLAHVREHLPDVDVAVITGHLELEFAIQALKNGAFDYLKKPFRFEEVLNTVRRVHEKQYLQRRSMELELLKERSRHEEQHLKEFMLTLAQVIDMKSSYTREHSDRTAHVAGRIAERLGLSTAEVDRITLGARLHDIGKIGVPDCILDKPGPLTPDEVEIMRTHPGRGAELCTCISCLTPIVPMVRWHHENLDGSGYPDGLRGNQIPVDARIVRIADYWDAITSHRSYRSPMETSKAISVIEEECECGRLDCEIVRHLFDMVRSGTLGPATPATATPRS